ncbi:Gfo/Idh/MocA family oxidoreductase [Candidatus Poribacteria bacterium]|nr:Gfo/Idh/MocA family oxidoreductase [Candidatus Poribacteria bacterium]MYG06290.1 Gfo/Idh/MocA family oxidoreductase [Candidatus Poribacteria bacterium]MYK23331.1 Gfo/Idh/MocA family oxidoreductase [Candidatus Poribacteria bacterium]
MKEVKIGFIGCGGNANGHMNQLSGIEGARIVAVCDVQPERAQSAAERHNADPYTAHQELLERDDLDAVYLSLPVFAHGEPELDVIHRGLPFFVEKPVAINMDTALMIEEELSSPTELITCVGYQLRYLGSTRITQQILQEKTINMIVGKYWCSTGHGDPNAWLRQMNKSGGQLVEQATHTIDMMRYMCGEVETVYAMQANRFLKETDCPDANSVALQFESGAVGSLTATWAYAGDWANANILDVLYEGELLNWNPSSVTVQENGDWVDKTAPSPTIDDVFVEAVRSGDASSILSPYSDAVKTLAISVAANQSAQENRPIDIAPILDWDAF